MDFESNLDWNISGIPAKTKLSAFTHLKLSLSSDAHSWETKYDMIGIGGGIKIEKTDPFVTKLTDGINSEGLSGAALWLPTSVYPSPKDAPKNARLISALDIVSWAISTHKNIQELKQSLEQIREGKPASSGELLYFWDPFQWNLPFSSGNLIPLHFQFHDKEGHSLVMEFRNGKIELTDNTDLGVMTNYPFIDWHRTNLENYLSITNLDTNDGNIVGMPLKALGHGNGTLGLSASPTPPARFVRTAKLLTFCTDWLKQHETEQAEAFAFNVLGNVTVLRAMSVDKPNDSKGDYTQWVLVRNHTDPKFYLRTGDGIGTWRIDFKNFIKKEPVHIPISDEKQGIAVLV
jgi:choloylglycine hydrolase